ncbi:MAG: sigma-70 family RNA polymerase sigma factor [Eubacterium sp.]|nr:sigma-70 family RNA polymerase sigma factor [Eubacterium sp.]
MDAETRLIEEAQRGDKDALVALVQKYRGLVAKISRTYFLIGGDQEDLLQEGMIALMGAVWDYKADRGMQFKNFAALCVENRIKTVIDAANRLKNSPLNQSVSLFQPVSEDDPETTLMDMLSSDGADDPERLALNQEMVDRIGRVAKEELSELEKQVLYHYLRGESHRVIAEKIGRPLKAVDNALQRIRKKF